MLHPGVLRAAGSAGRLAGDHSGDPACVCLAAAPGQLIKLPAGRPGDARIPGGR